MLDAIAGRIAAGLASRAEAAANVARLEDLAAARPDPLPIQRREPSAPSDRMAAFTALSERVRADGSRALAPPRPSVPGVTDRLPPAHDGAMTRADNHVSKLHTEIKLDGKVIARIYNSGAAEFADDYAYLANGMRGETLVGPDLAAQRLAKVRAALERGGATIAEAGAASGGLPPARYPGTSVAEIRRASTAQTQQEWLAFKATEPPPPGSFFTRSA